MTTQELEMMLFGNVFYKIYKSKYLTQIVHIKPEFVKL